MNGVCKIEFKMTTISNDNNRMYVSIGSHVFLPLHVPVRKNCILKKYYRNLVVVFFLDGNMNVGLFCICCRCWSIGWSNGRSVGLSIK